MKRLQNIFSIFRKETHQIVILTTGDVHGTIHPYDYIRDRVSQCGLAKIATRVESYRKKYENVILIDNGDFLQGSPLNYYYNFIDTRAPYPLAVVMNQMGYTATSVGNHDIEQGPTVYNRVKRQLKFPWLSANARTKSGKSYFQPFTIREVNGIKMGILGLTTPAIPLWVNTRNYRGIRWQDMKEAAAGWIRFLKHDKKSDILIGLFHAGIHPNADQPHWPREIPEENPSLEIARDHPQYDVIIAGHEHGTYNSHPKNKRHQTKKPLVIMTGSNGCYLGVVHLVFEKRTGNWSLKEKYCEIESLRGVKPHPQILELYQPYHNQVLNYIDRVVGEALTDISTHHARFKDNASVNLIHQAQLDATTATISLVTAFTMRYTLKKGPIRIKDIYGLYQYENNLYVILMTGHQIKEHLENVARYFNRIDPRKPHRNPLVNKDFKGFNYDMAKGIDYEIDITKPAGQRISIIRDTRNGKPLDLNSKYKVAVNSYRAIQLQKKYGCRILWMSDKEMRDILVEYIQKIKKVGNYYQENWRLVPREVVNQVLR